ncbi:MAG: TetR/AcrR family transcriptional regulator [Desulfosporosinus sp.]|nr:TetR/AcrR family transcriptional regulator [Desulfosporosinus sp.]
MLKEPTQQSRTERKKDKMRQLIVEVALDLFRKQGFFCTTMEQIAQEVDIAKKTLYNYFPEKEAILSTYAQGIIEEGRMYLDEYIGKYPDISSYLLAMFEKASQLCGTDPEIWRVYIAYRMRYKLNPAKDTQLRSGLEDLFTKMIEQAQKTGQIRPDIPAQDLAKQLEMSYSLAVLAWLTDPENISLSDSLVRCVDIFLNGTKSR